MGASCSSARNAASTCPEELLVEILSNLPVPDLISCRRINHHLNDIINKSERLQHHIDTAIAGVLDNPNSSLSLSKRRDALARRQEAWDTLQPQWTSTSTAQLMDEFPRDGTWLPLDPLREHDHMIGGLAACPDNDGLVAVWLRSGTTPSDWFNKNHSLEVDILHLSEGGGERLWTRKRSIHVKDIQNSVGWEINIEVHTKFFAVLFRPTSSSLGYLPDKELWVFDWETGEKIACLRGQRISAFRFLSSSVMVVARVTPDESTAALELFSFPVTNGKTSLEKVAVLGLPFVDTRCRIARIDFYPSLVKNLRIQSRLLYDAAIDVKPFVSPNSNNIILATLNIGSSYGYDNISFVVYPSTLLRHAIPPHSYDHMGGPVPWESWGPAATRWFGEGGGTRVKGQAVCGERCLLKPQYPAGWELLDFNPYRVRRLGHGLSVESATACLTVETEPSCAKCHGIKEGIYSSLPFVKLVPKKWPEYTYMSLYEDRVIGERYRLNDGYEFEQLHFG